MRLGGLWRRSSSALRLRNNWRLLTRQAHVSRSFNLEEGLVSTSSTQVCSERHEVHRLVRLVTNARLCTLELSCYYCGLSSATSRHNLVSSCERNVGCSRLPRVIVLGQNGVCYSASRVRLIQARQRCADPPPPASPASQATAKSSTTNATYKLNKFHRSNHLKKHTG